MDWSFDSSRAIYAQIVEKIKLYIISGKLEPGEKMPPVRELASAAGVNPNTMQKAMAYLEQSGLVYSSRTSGRFVTEDRELISEEKQKIANAQITEFFNQMGKTGFTHEEVISLINNYRNEQ